MEKWSYLGNGERHRCKETFLMFLKFSSPFPFSPSTFPSLFLSSPCSFSFPNHVSICSGLAAIFNGKFQAMGRILEAVNAWHWTEYKIIFVFMRPCVLHFLSYLSSTFPFPFPSPFPALFPSPSPFPFSSPFLLPHFSTLFPSLSPSLFPSPSPFPCPFLFPFFPFPSASSSLYLPLPLSFTYPSP